MIDRDEDREQCEATKFDRRQSTSGSARQRALVVDVERDRRSQFGISLLLASRLRIAMSLSHKLCKTCGRGICAYPGCKLAVIE